VNVSGSFYVGAMTDQLADFDRRPMRFGDADHDVFVAGSGPAVVICPGMPDITPDDVADFGRREAVQAGFTVYQAGFTVYVASLFGVPGKAFSNRCVASSFAKACVHNQFLAFARGERAPITNFNGVEIDSSPGNAHGYGQDAHSVLTAEYSTDQDHPTNQAMELVLDHFRQKLLP